MEDDDLNQDSTGTLGQIRDQLGEMLDPSTTVEAQGYARQFLDKQLNSPLAGEQKKILTEMERQSKEAQEVLRAARAKLLARRYNPSDRWYSLAKALGAPTRVGGVGELASRAAGALNESRGRREEFEEKRDVNALGYDEKIAQLGMDLLKLRSGVAHNQGVIDADLAKESLKTLGKRVNPQANSLSKAQQALDREYVKDYLDWNQNGQSVANKSLTELAQARDRLRGYSVDEKGVRHPITEGDFATRQLGPTGRVIGSVSTVPIVGKAIQDVVAPGSADIRELVEATVQSSLRPILGAQFTEKEGERLIARVYNPRLKPEINAARVQRLLDQVATASKAKTAAAQWFEEHGTLSGYKGKYKFTLDDFMPPAGNELAEASQPSGEVDDHGVPYDGPPNPYRGTDEDNNAPAGGGPSPLQSSHEGDTFQGRPVIDYRDLPKRRLAKAEGGRVARAEGGPAADGDEIAVRMPDGTVKLMPAGTAYEDVAGTLPEGESAPGYDSALSRVALAGLGAGAGYAGGRLLSGLGSTAMDLKPGNKETPAQARLLRLMERSNMSPQQLTQFQKRFARLGVPTMPLDFSPDLRAAAETSLGQGGPHALEMMDRLRERQIGARGRALEQVNQGLKPDDYFAEEKNIKTKLYGDKVAGTESESAPLYRAAESQFPSISSAELGKLMDTPTGKKAVKAAMQTMKDRGKPIGKVNPVTGAVMKPSLEFLNQVKIEMDNLVGAAKKKGKDARARDITSLRTSFRNELDTATTDPATGSSPYKEARETYESRKAHLDALQTGREDFSRMQPQEVEQAVANMNFEQKDAFRTGVAQHITEMLNTPSTDINAAKRLVGSPAMQAKLGALFDTPQEFEIFRTALAKEVETFENSQKLLQRESTVRQRGVTPPKGRIARAAEKAPALGLLSPTHWALKILREKPEITEKEAGEVLNLLKSSTPDEITNFEKSLGKKFGRAAARKKRGSRMGMAGAALGAAAGALWGGDDDEEPADEDVLAGLDQEGREAARKPAGYAEGGKISGLKGLMARIEERILSLDSIIGDDSKPEPARRAAAAELSRLYDQHFKKARETSADLDVEMAEGGKASLVKELIEDLRAKYKSMDAEQLKSQLMNIAVKIGETPQNVWKAVVGIETPAATAPSVLIPAQPEQLAPFAKSMDMEKARLKQLQLSLQSRADLPPEMVNQAQTASLGAQGAYDQMMSNPSYANMQRLSEMVRSLSQLAERRKTERAKGGRMGRQFGGGTNHA